MIAGEAPDRRPTSATSHGHGGFGAARGENERRRAGAEQEEEDEDDDVDADDDWASLSPAERRIRTEKEWAAGAGALYLELADELLARPHVRALILEADDFATIVRDEQAHVALYQSHRTTPKAVFRDAKEFFHALDPSSPFLQGCVCAALVRCAPIAAALDLFQELWHALAEERRHRRRTHRQHIAPITTATAAAATVFASPTTPTPTAHHTAPNDTDADADVGIDDDDGESGDDDEGNRFIDQLLQLPDFRGQSPEREAMFVPPPTHPDVGGGDRATGQRQGKGVGARPATSSGMRRTGGANERLAVHEDRWRPHSAVGVRTVSQKHSERAGRDDDSDDDVAGGQLEYRDRKKTFNDLGLGSLVLTLASTRPGAGAKKIPDARAPVPISGRRRRRRGDRPATATAGASDRRAAQPVARPGTATGHATADAATRRTSVRERDIFAEHTATLPIGRTSASSKRGTSADARTPSSASAAVNTATTANPTAKLTYAQLSALSARGGTALAGGHESVSFLKLRYARSLEGAVATLLKGDRDRTAKRGWDTRFWWRHEPYHHERQTHRHSHLHTHPHPHPPPQRRVPVLDVLLQSVFREMLVTYLAPASAGVRPPRQPSPTRRDPLADVPDLDADLIGAVVEYGQLRQLAAVASVLSTSQAHHERQLAAALSNQYDDDDEDDRGASAYQASLSQQAGPQGAQDPWPQWKDDHDVLVGDLPSCSSSVVEVEPPRSTITADTRYALPNVTVPGASALADIREDTAEAFSGVVHEGRFRTVTLGSFRDPPFSAASAAAPLPVFGSYKRPVSSPGARPVFSALATATATPAQRANAPRAAAVARARSAAAARPPFLNFVSFGSMSQSFSTGDDVTASRSGGTATAAGVDIKKLADATDRSGPWAHHAASSSSAEIKVTPQPSLSLPPAPSPGKAAHALVVRTMSAASGLSHKTLSRPASAAALGSPGGASISSGRSLQERLARRQSLTQVHESTDYLGTTDAGGLVQNMRADLLAAVATTHVGDASKRGHTAVAGPEAPASAAHARPGGTGASFKPTFANFELAAQPAPVITFTPPAPGPRRKVSAFRETMFDTSTAEGQRKEARRPSTATVAGGAAALPAAVPVPVQDSKERRASTQKPPTTSQRRSSTTDQGQETPGGRRASLREQDASATAASLLRLQNMFNGGDNAGHVATADARRSSSAAQRAADQQQQQQHSKAQGEATPASAKSASSRRHLRFVISDDSATSGKTSSKNK
jgi:hypothetical protein